MGRRKIFMYFDERAYLKALKKELRKAIEDIRNMLWEQAIENASSLPFKTNPVRLAGQSDPTSDYERRMALINSIIYERVQNYRDIAYYTTISAMKDNWKESHIGIYYEFGTGEHEEPNPYSKLGDPNPFRTGKEIVSRSRFGFTRTKEGKLKTLRDEKGIPIIQNTWRDAGGNLRITGSIRGGENDEGFREYIGDDVKAYHWFSKIIDQRRQEIIERIKEAIKKVNPLKFFRLSDLHLG